MVKVIVPVPDRCSGCGYCVIACPLVHGHGLSPTKASLRLEKRRIDVDMVVVCTHGEGCDLECIQACPAEAMYIAASGAVTVNHDECIACGSCGRACPYHVIWYDEGGKANKCDLCDCDPACVRYCLLEAIELREVTDEDFALMRKELEVEY